MPTCHTESTMVTLRFMRVLLMRDASNLVFAAVVTVHHMTLQLCS
jgi:hypothetical protein